MNLPARPELIRIHPVTFSPLQPFAADCLRLDLVHPQLSGNKWFKLQPWLQLALQEGASGVASYGGAWSNHLLALAAAAQSIGLPSYGLIRGETSQTAVLNDAKAMGMHLVFLSRDEYRQGSSQGTKPAALPYSVFVIPEGGQGIPGVIGAAAIFDWIPLAHRYTHFAVAMGTGTTLAGMLRQLQPHQQLIGISALKGEDRLTGQVSQWTPGREQQFRVFNQFHFGGYAKHDDTLLDFMNDMFRINQLPLDKVYTGKLFYGIAELIKEKYFPPDARLLLVHSGGLSGNRSLPVDRLIY